MFGTWGNAISAIVMSHQSTGSTHVMKKRSFYAILGQERLFTLATGITIIRLLLIPYIAHAMLTQQWFFAGQLFVCAALSDAFDGLLARMRNECTLFGAILDALTDKILILTMLTILTFVPTPLFPIPYWFFIFICCKELCQIIGCITFLCMQGYIDVQPLLLGKMTMTVYTALITWLFACHFYDWMPVKTYMIVLPVVSVLAFLGLLQYFKQAYDIIINHQQKGNMR